MERGPKELEPRPPLLKGQGAEGRVPLELEVACRSGGAQSRIQRGKDPRARQDRRLSPSKTAPPMLQSGSSLRRSRST